MYSFLSVRRMRPQIKIILANFFFEYETPRQVLVRNKKVAVACRIIQMGVLAYIIGWVFMYEKGYHAIDTAIGSVFTKMKGLSFTNISGKVRIWDAADFVFPEQGASSFVVMTNFIATVGQKQDKCPELQDGKNTCKTDADCDEGKYKRTGNGKVLTITFFRQKAPAQQTNFTSLAAGGRGTHLLSVFYGHCIIPLTFIGN